MVPARTAAAARLARRGLPFRSRFSGGLGLLFLGLVRTCTELLDHAELEVVKLMNGPDGEPVEQEFVRDE